MLIVNEKKSGIDLLIIMFATICFWGVYGIFYMWLKFDIGNLPLLVQTLIGALFEFGAMGFGVTIVCVLNKESFASFGLKKEKLLLTIVLSALACLPSFMLTLFTNKMISYLPLQNVNFTKPVLAANFPINIIGMLVIIVVWGFFEGFTYVVISDKINKLIPPKNCIINFGAIFCGLFCLLIHILVGQHYNIAEAVTEFIIIYGMLAGYRYTGNAWGCILIFCFYWSAIGLK